jgi:hypothetical protein
MYTRHPEFEELDDNAMLWRYFDLPRYLDLLLREQMFFPCANILEDPFEGEPAGSKDRHAGDGKCSALAVSSWHNNKQENYAMWKIYAYGNAGLAIQTTFGQLKNSFLVTDKPVWIGKVAYYEDDRAPDLAGKPYARFLHKRSIYAYENEVRCCYHLDTESNEEYTWEEQGQVYGVFIPVDLSLLINRIFISPYAPQWFRELVTGINQRLGVDKEIVHSRVFEK